MGLSLDLEVQLASARAAHVQRCHLDVKRVVWTLQTVEQGREGTHQASLVARGCNSSLKARCVTASKQR